MLAEGDREDDIEVQKIDEPGAIITFDNHGVVQELPLVPAGTGNGGAPAGSGFRPPLPTPGRPAGGQLPGGFNQTTVLTPFSNPTPPPNTPSASSTAASANSAPMQEQITPEAQVILMEAQRMQWQNEGDTETAKAVIPPTEMTSMLNGEGETNGDPTQVP